MMGVAKEGDLAGGIQKPFEGLRGSEVVFVFILEGAVDEDDAIGFEGALGQTGEPVQVFIRELRTGPIHGGFGYRIEVIGGHEFGDCLIVIAPNCYSTEFADARGDFVGIGSVADDITEANQALPAPLCGGETRTPSSQICVDIPKASKTPPLS